MNASAISLGNSTSQYYFAGSPIVATINVPANTFPSGSSLRRVHIVVQTNYAGTVCTFPFIRESDNSEQFTEDISSAVRGAIAGAEITPPNGLQGVIRFSVGAYASWLSNGEAVNDESGMTFTSFYKALPGAFTELELLELGHNRLPSSYPLYTKPEGFVFFLPFEGYDAHFPRINGDTISGGVVNFAPETNPRTGEVIPLGPCSTTQLGKTYGYDMEAYNKCFPLIFLNRRGQLEDACAMPLEALSYNVEKKEYEQIGAPSETPVASLRSQRTGARRMYSMSSGYCSKEMAEWWINEFLCSESYWMKMGNNWIPCSVTPSNKKVVLYDRANPSALAVNFTVTLGLVG